MPRFWRLHVAIFAITCLAAFALILWRNSMWYGIIPFIVGLLLTLHLRRFVRCPKCKRRLQVRMEPYENDCRRYVYDCPDCQITWDPGYVERPAD